ncbi:tetratricopeptide repeat protein 12 [Aplysia californica]|uniref:Protein unc-45 homolog B n=1 Tax=Aplysia californica TaxID=6500 RepID=A0ABM1A4X5_APLCA|nr:tetratricopeptide repeat protein 12 [Aplysia californica]
MADLPKPPNQPSEAELNDFLSKVDEIESVIKGLNSEDDEKRQLSSKKADNIIHKLEIEKKKVTDEKAEVTEDADLPQTRTGFSRTSINKEAFKNEPPPSQTVGQVVNEQPMDQTAFMAAMETDAKERAADKKKRQKIADGFKEQGNVEFRQGNFEKALEFYDKAMEQIRDNLAIYTNRAQARIKLEMFTEALTDCHWALRLTPGCMKAYVQQGHAYLGMNEYEKARESYREILKIDNKKENIVKEYLAEVDRVEQASQAEVKATELFESGQEVAKGVVDVLGKVVKADQLPLYYSGGFRVLTSLLDSVDSRTLFRTNDGLQLPQNHPVLKRCLSSSPTSLSREERDLVSAALDMLTSACKDNETSQQKLMQLPGFPEQMIVILEAKFKGQGRLLRTSCLNLLHETSLTDAGRGVIVAKYDIHRLISALLPLMVKPSSYTDTAAAVLNNIALEKKVKTLLRDNIEVKILPEFENLLSSNKTSAQIAGLAASSATNLAGDPIVRNKMAAQPILWETSARLMQSFSEGKLSSPLESVSGLLVNISTGVASAQLSDVSPDVSSACYAVMTSESASDVAVSRSLAVLSNILPHNSAAVGFMSEGERVVTILNLLKCGDSVKEKSALKCLTALTRDSGSVRQVVADNKGTSLLLNLLNSEDENTLGNCALCLSHICAVDKVCSKLTKTNIIQRLLVLARDGRKPNVQSNCAILIGKLAQGDARHLERLRELHGIEILHSCMKHVK